MSDPDKKEQEQVKESQEQHTESEDIDAANFPKLRESDWMLKPCDVYLMEFKDCKSIAARYYQNFYYGETLNCTQWKTDYENCQKWQQTDDDTAYDKLLASEKKRRLERLKPHVANDVWKPRKTPPVDWNDPLPDWMIKRQAPTYLAAKQNEATATGKYSTIDLYAPSCTIL